MPTEHIQIHTCGRCGEKVDGLTWYYYGRLRRDARSAYDRVPEDGIDLCEECLKEVTEAVDKIIEGRP